MVTARNAFTQTLFQSGAYFLCTFPTLLGARIICSLFFGSLWPLPVLAQLEGRANHVGYMEQHPGPQEAARLAAGEAAAAAEGPGAAVRVGYVLANQAEGSAARGLRCSSGYYYAKAIETKHW